MTNHAADLVGVLAAGGIVITLAWHTATTRLGTDHRADDRRSRRRLLHELERYEP